MEIFCEWFTYILLSEKKQQLKVISLNSLSRIIYPISIFQRTLVASISRYHRNASTLVVIEHSDAEITPATLHSITAANQLGGNVTCLVAGVNCAPVSYFLYSFAKPRNIKKNVVFTTKWCICVEFFSNVRLHLNYQKLKGFLKYSSLKMIAIKGTYQVWAMISSSTEKAY